MGSACCVAARDKTIVNGSGVEVLHRTIRYSPTWSFRWDNRGRVAGEDTSISLFSDGGSRNDGSDIKYESAYSSEDGSPSDTAQSLTWQKSLISEVNPGQMRTPASDQSISRNMSMDVNSEQVKGSTDSPAVLCQSPTKYSVSLTSTSSLTTYPLSSQSQEHLGSSSILKWSLRSPENHLSRQISDKMSRLKSSKGYSHTEERLLPSCCGESTGGSQGGSSDGWSMHAFSELVAASRGERWSVDNESWGFSHEKIRRSSGRISVSPSADPKTCGVCAKLLTDKSSCSSQKIMITNELSVVAVLTCGHVYHAECLENLTPEIDKYDPSCPTCTLGETKMHKLSEKALKVELELKAKINKRSRRRMVDSDLDDEFVAFNQLKGNGREGKASSSSKASSTRPFLRRHFSFGSKDSISLSDNNPARKRGLFWAKSSKM